ncbi:MAG: hypothetical protein MUF84_04995 [Anaerolineae bacterium]|jgi:hypothetical protein|nr:hypothetical protein [Anaerolineae bacterium]
MKPVVCQEVEMPERALSEMAPSARVSAEPVPQERALALAEGILALCEPWRSRFMVLVARFAGADVVTRAELDPDRVMDVEGPGDPEVDTTTVSELAEWLADADLHERIRLMLRAWTSSK